MRRERGIALLTTVLTSAAQANDRPLSMLDEIHVFGSFARGALEPHDVDVDVEFTTDWEFASDMARSMSRGQDPCAPIRHALIGRQRGIQFQFQELRTLTSDGIETTLLWRRGDSLTTALARLHAIEPDSTASRAPRDAMLPAFDGIDQWVPRPAREMLSAWSSAGAITVQRIDLPEARARNTLIRDTITRRWSETSPLRHAAHAALARLEQQGIQAKAVHLHGRDLVRDSDTPYFIGFQWRYANAIHSCLTRWGGVQWLEVPHPTRSGALPALQIDCTDRDALLAQQATW